MSIEEKKAFLLLKAVIFYYHGLDEEEENILNDTADKHKAHTEKDWAISFVEEDEVSAFRRARAFFMETIATYGKDKKMEYLEMVWEDNDRKGYITEMEATGMLKLAKDWGIQSDFLNLVRQKVSG